MDEETGEWDGKRISKKRGSTGETIREQDVNENGEELSKKGEGKKRKRTSGQKGEGEGKESATSVAHMQGWSCKNQREDEGARGDYNRQKLGGACIMKSVQRKWSRRRSKQLIGDRKTNGEKKGFCQGKERVMVYGNSKNVTRLAERKGRSRMGGAGEWAGWIR